MQKSSKRKKPMTLLEKADLLHGQGDWVLPGCPRLGIRSMVLSDGPLGLRKVEPGKVGLYASLPSTCYPSPALLACSFDRELEQRIGAALAQECAEKGVDMLLAPGVNIKRNPLCGRNFEYFSEDPLLSGEMGAAFILGLQNEGVGACLKHFAANNQESYRNINDSIVDERALREIYLRPFEIAIREADPWAVMASYNLVNGTHAAENEWLLLHVLREEWGYAGVTMSDWGATIDPVDSHDHGLDIEMPCHVKGRSKEIARAMKAKRLSPKRFDASVTRVKAMLAKSGGEKRPHYDPEACHALAVEAAEKSFVLLSNVDSFLPFASLDGCCVIGALADLTRYQGEGSSHVNAPRAVSFLKALGEANVPYAPGYSLSGSEEESALSIAACDLASRCQNVILFLGLPEGSESEGYDRQNMNLPDNQLALFSSLAAVNRNIVVVLLCGAPVALPFRQDAKAILLCYLGGEGVGEAILHTLLGQANPSGKLAESWPCHLSDVPNFGFYPGYEGQSLYKESIYVGYRYYLTAEKKVAYPFGHGLSYTHYSYSLSLSAASLAGEETCTASVTVHNDGERDGECVVELYAEARDPGNAFKPKRVLIGFAKVAVKANKGKKVSFALRPSNFAVYDVRSHSFRPETGDYLVEVGSSCTAIEASAPLFVQGGKEFPSLRDNCPVYYALPVEGFVNYDDEFEALLGRHVGLGKDRHSRPYDRESTVGDISATWIGSKIIAAARKSHFDPNAPEGERKMMEQSFLDMPLRALAMGGVSEKAIQAIIDLANGSPFPALWHLAFGARKKKPTAKKAR